MWVVDKGSVKAACSVQLAVSAYLRGKLSREAGGVGGRVSCRHAGDHGAGCVK